MKYDRNKSHVKHFGEKLKPTSPSSFFQKNFFSREFFSTFFSWRQKTAPEKKLGLHRNFFSLSLEKQWQGEKSPKPDFEFWRRCQTLQKLGCLSRLFGNKNVWSAAVAAAAVEAVDAVVAVVAAVVAVAVDAEDEQTASMWMRQKIALQDTAKKIFFLLVRITTAAAAGSLKKSSAGQIKARQSSHRDEISIVLVSQHRPLLKRFFIQFSVRQRTCGQQVAVVVDGHGHWRRRRRRCRQRRVGVRHEVAVVSRRGVLPRIGHQVPAVVVWQLLQRWKRSNAGLVAKKHKQVKKLESNNSSIGHKSLALELVWYTRISAKNIITVLQPSSPFKRLRIAFSYLHPREAFISQSPTKLMKKTTYPCLSIFMLKEIMSLLPSPIKINF